MPDVKLTKANQIYRLLCPLFCHPVVLSTIVYSLCMRPMRNENQIPWRRPPPPASKLQLEDGAEVVH
eukprot:2067142-Amphidinium_carterae.1